MSYICAYCVSLRNILTIPPPPCYTYTCGLLFHRYLPQLFDIATALVLCSAVRERKPLEDGLKVMLDALIEARS